jgi:Ser/Thr protein kinase RdoA (MazF antagonist)
VADVAGRQPTVPWQDDELELVLAALDRLTAALTPVPVPVGPAVPAVAARLGADFTGWRVLARTPGDDRLDPWSRAHLAELAALEATWERHAAGDTLLHADLRADNLLLSRAGAGERLSDVRADGRLSGDGDADPQVVVVDWPHACRGAAFVDLVCFAPSVAMQDGPGPPELLARSRAGRKASRESVAAVVCALAGYFTERSLQPAPPGLPTLRAFQAAQGEVTCRWLAALMRA